MAVETLEGRMLCASTLTYGIKEDGNLDVEANRKYCDGAGFVEPPVPFSAGFESVNACFVGRNVDGIVLAFRGTLAPEHGHTMRALADWMNDFDSRPVKPELDFPGDVHEGFWRALEELSVTHSANGSTMPEEIEKQMQAAGDDVKLYITGHSKGGGISPLAAWQLLSDRKIEPAGILTYAAPRCGTKAFVKEYDAKLGDRTIRYEYQDDIVPHLPPHSIFVNALEHVPGIGDFFEHHLDWNYKEVGSLKYINSSSEIVESSMTLNLKRLAHMAGQVAEGHLKKIATDHMSAAGFGYMNTLCPDIPVD